MVTTAGTGRWLASATPARWPTARRCFFKLYSLPAGRCAVRRCWDGTSPRRSGLSKNYTSGLLDQHHTLAEEIGSHGAGTVGHRGLGATAANRWLAVADDKPNLRFSAAIERRQRLLLLSVLSGVHGASPTQMLRVDGYNVRRPEWIIHAVLARKRLDGELVILPESGRALFGATTGPELGCVHFHGRTRSVNPRPKT